MDYFALIPLESLVLFEIIVPLLGDGEKEQSLHLCLQVLLLLQDCHLIHYAIWNPIILVSGDPGMLQSILSLVPLVRLHRR